MVMSEAGARDFISRVEGDERFARELEALKEDPQAALARVQGEGFDAEPTEIRAAFLDRYGAELSPEQLDGIVAGTRAENEQLGVAIGAGGGVVAVAAICAAF
jgi:predicted ribosomally synthesized peptide with nif11-like leader